MHKLKNDRYRHVRGGSSKLLIVKCSHCSNPIMLYQKDGKGTLKRTYLDRIFEPSSLLSLIKSDSRLALTCPKCKTLIGKPYIYKKENRPAYLLIPGSFRTNEYINIKDTQDIFNP